MIWMKRPKKEYTTIKGERDDAIESVLARQVPLIMSRLGSHPMTTYLSFLERGILTQITYWMLRRVARGSSGALYSTPSEMQIAKFVDCNRVTVSRNVSRLSSKGLLSVVNRRPINGSWQTNLYKHCSLIFTILDEIIKNFSLFIKRVTSMLHLVRTKGTINTFQKKKLEFSIKLRSPDLVEIFKRVESKHPELAT